MGWLDDCRLACKKIKYLGEHIEWGERPNHSGWLQATSSLLDSSRASIPGLTFVGEYQPRRWGDVHSYALLFTQGRDKRRVFMLEVYPSHVRSHVDVDSEVYGPHFHLGDHRDEQLVRSIRGLVDALPQERWIRRFKAHTSISDIGSYVLTHPLSGSLFG